MSEINGKISVIGDVQQIGASFRKRELVVTTEEQYPQSILIEFHGDSVGFLDYYRLGEYVKVKINIRGRKWTNQEGVDKYFNTLVGWKLDRLDIQPAVIQETPVHNAVPAFPTVNNDLPEIEHDDLPF